MPTFDARNTAAICGVGMSPMGHLDDRSTLSLIAEALRNALADCGLEKQDLDGILVNIGYPMGCDFDVICETLGLEVRLADQTWTHGRMLCNVLINAALAVSAGLATHVACVCGVGFHKMRTFGGEADSEGYREQGGPHGELPHYGSTGPGTGAAFAARRYFGKYGGSPEQLSAVAMAQRKWANLNPQAFFHKKPMTKADYLASRYIFEPLRLLDCCLMSDGAAVVIVTTAERARDMKRAPVYLSGFSSMGHGRALPVMSLPGLGLKQQPDFDYSVDPRDLPVYKMAGVLPADIQAFYTYDAFTPMVMLSLEYFGFCKAGEAKDWVQNGRIEPGGALPLNTNGGLLSEGHVSAWNHMVEIVRQLRGECGARQVPGVEIAQWGSALGDAIVFRR